MAHLPTGTVTFLFMDIEGSTALWERDRAAMRAAVDRQLAILQSLIAAHHGVLSKTIGDGTQAAFASAEAALRAALASQRALQAEVWTDPPGPLRVRMALHAGEAAPDARGDYLAAPLNRLAQLLEAGHGGQILLSHTVQQLTRGALPAGCALRDLGEHRLRDLLELERVYQLVHPDLPTEFPPLKSLENRPNNLPRQPTPFLSSQPEWVSAGGVGSHVPGTLPRIWNVPHPRITNFTGRDRELAMLGEALASDQRAAAVQAMYGLGGIGKTQIAVEYAYRHAVDRDDYSITWWVRSEHLTTMVADYTGLAHALILPTASDPDPAITVAGVRTWLEQTGEPWLLVFDNANAPEDIRSYLPRAGTGDVVITSRNPGWNAVAQPIAVDALPVSDAVAFLRARTGRDEAAAVDLVQELGRLPLALEQAAAYVTANRVSLSWYLASFREHHGRMLERAKPHTDYPWTVATTWELAFKQLEEQVPVARDLLALCAFLDPDDIPLDVIVSGAGELPAPLSRVLVDALERTEVVAVLHRYSLLNLIDEMSLSVHRLVQLVARDRLGRAEGARWATEAMEVILAAFPNDCNNTAHWTVCARLLPHGLAVTRHAAELKAAPVQTAALLARIALYLHARGMFQEARGAHEQVVGILEAVLPPDHPDIATSLTNQAVVLHDMGDLRGARTRLERALAILESRLPSVHPDIATTLNNLALVLQDLGDVSGALTRLRRALAIREALLPPTHSDIATSLGSLAEVYRAQGDLTRARELQERALSILEAVLPADHLDIAAAHNNLGEVLRAKGDLAGAYARHRRALSIREAVLPPDHPDLAKSLNNLAAVLRAQGDLRGAREQLERALAIRERVLPPNHPHIASSLNNLAGVLYARGDLDGALAALLRALPIFQTQKLRDRERGVLLSLATLARRLGRPGAALDLLIACYLIDRYIGHRELSFDLTAATALAKDLGLDERALTERISAVAASYRQDRGASLLTAAFPDRFEQPRPVRAR
jgi:class 3 adenylate cyclase/Tfp pilus assembly protein PilF